MPVYADGFAAAEAEVLLCFGEVGTRAYDIASVRGCIADVRTGIEIACSTFPEINRHGPAVTASASGHDKGLIPGPSSTQWPTADQNHVPAQMANIGDNGVDATLPPQRRRRGQGGR